MSASTRHPECEHALPGWGAFKHSDTEDAKRRRPERAAGGLPRHVSLAGVAL